MSPAQAVRARAITEHAKHGGLGFATDASADPVLIGLATPVCACVIEVDRAEYDPIKLAEHLGFQMKTPTAMERLKKGK